MYSKTRSNIHTIFGILKSKVELAKAFDHKGCKHAACKQECVSDQMMSSIYIGAKDQRVRDKN